MERPDITGALPALAAAGLDLDIMRTSFFVGRETLIPNHAKGGLPAWQEPIFVALAKTAASATDFFGLPPNRVVELGAQVEI